MYQARILDKTRQLKAILPGVRWSYNRRINTATSIEIHIPRESIDEHIPQGHALYGFFAPSQPFAAQAKPVRAKPNKAQYAEIASYVQIYKGDKLKASGKIVGRTLGQVVTVEAYTEEILLEANLTPAQYGKVWDGWDLADVARDLLDGWQSLRVKAQSQWQDRMVDSSNVDLTTDPGLVMLAKRASGQYYDSGYITLVFNKSEIPNFKAWDRVRWSADSEDPVKTSIQISTNGTSFSAPFDGGLPEEVGYYIGGDHDQVWVRINLSTSDTESEDENGNKVGVTPTVFALEVIARTEGKLAVGSVPSVAGVTVKGLSADYASGLQVLVQACEQTGWEFSVWNGTLNLAEKLGVDRTKDFVLRAGTNMEITSLGDDDEELVNILTAYGPGSGINRMEITLRDEDSIAQFGPYPKAMEFEAETLAELEQKAQEYLDSHNTPTVAFEVAAVFDFEHEPEYGLGDVVRVVDPETGIVTTTRIMAEAREYNEQGLSVHLELGKAGFTLAEAISGEKRVAKPLDPMQPTGVWARGIIDGIQVGFSKPKFDDWAYTEVHMSTEPIFIPSAQTLVDQGKQATFDIVGLVPAIRYYFCVTHVDMSGRRSQPSKVVSAIPGVINNIPVQWDHENGLVSQLNMTGLFLTDPQNPDSVYAARMVMGTASDGQTITLDWTFHPKIIVAPFSILTYIADEADNNQRIEAWVENVSPKGFTAHCRLMIPGAETKHTVNYRMNNPVAEWTSGNSAPGVQDLRLELRLYKEASGLYSLSTTQITQKYRIEYLRLDGGPGTWELFGEFTDTRSLYNPNWLIRQTITDLQTKQHTLLLPPGQYQIRVTYTNFDWSGGNAFGRSGYIQVNTWGYRTDQIAQQGDLIYFAIEGGAVSESGE